MNPCIVSNSDNPLNRRIQSARSASRRFIRLVAASVLVVLSGVLCTPASAQSLKWQLDLTGSRIQYDSLAALNSPSVATSLEWQGRRFLARFGSSLTGFEGNGRSIRGNADVVGWLSPAGMRTPFRLELRGSIGGSRHSSAFGSYLGQATIRLHLHSQTVGGWLGTSAGVSENTFDMKPLTSVVPAAGGWIRLGRIRLSAQFLDSRVDGSRFPEASSAGIYSGGRFDVTLFGGFRDVKVDRRGSETWYGGSLAVWVLSDVGVLVSGGQYASDVLRGFPGGDFVSVGVRYSPRRRRTAVSRQPVALMFTQEFAENGEIGFVVEGAQSVAIAGDWNGWQPEPLTRNPRGRWLLPEGVPAGVHRFNLLVNGRKWVVPDAVPSIDDDFGGKVGLLVILAE